MSRPDFNFQSWKVSFRYSQKRYINYVLFSLELSDKRITILSFVVEETECDDTCFPDKINIPLLSIQLDVKIPSFMNKVPPFFEKVFRNGKNVEYFLKNFTDTEY